MESAVVTQKPMMTSHHGSMMTTVITAPGFAPVAVARTKAGTVAFVSGMEVSISSFANKLRAFASAGVNMTAVVPAVARYGIEF